MSASRSVVALTPSSLARAAGLSRSPGCNFPSRTCAAMNRRMAVRVGSDWRIGLLSKPEYILYSSRHKGIFSQALYLRRDRRLQMKVAALYDIHGNLPALDAVLREVREQAVDQIVVGGDVVLGPMPRECLSRVMELDIPTLFVKGNCDR